MESLVPFGCDPTNWETLLLTGTGHGEDDDDDDDDDDDKRDVLYALRFQMVYICHYISHYGMIKLQELQDDHKDRRVHATADDRMGMLQDSLEEQVHDYHSMHFGYANKNDVKGELRTFGRYSGPLQTAKRAIHESF